MAKLHGLQKRELLEIYQLMKNTRLTDERMLMMLRQGKSFFHIGAAGHEAAQVAAAKTLNPGEDWAYAYYRDAAFCQGLGMTSEEQFLAFLARKTDPNSGGRQMPQHYGHKDLRIVSQSSATGTQYLQAVGLAMTRRWEKTKEVVYVSSGEGTTSQGDFHEALNWACREKLPVIFHIQDNAYAISVHVSEQTAGGSVYSLVSGYPHLARYDVDGTDYFETNLAFRNAVDRARKGRGPAVIVSHVVRLLPHSSSDDQRKYRKSSELKDEESKDPISTFQKLCTEAKICTAQEFKALDDKLFKEVEASALKAEEADQPDIESVEQFVYSDEPAPEETKFNSISEKVVMVDAINHALKEEAERNPKMIIYGEDVADPKGGVFTATRGLSNKFGKARVFNSPLAESSIIGTAVGMATVGYKPVVEIQFGDYIWTSMMQIRNEVATLRYRSNNDWSCPMVIRIPVGGYIHGGLCHSQSIDGYFMHLPGIYIAYPSNAADAKGLLKAACRMNDPVMFLEHKGLYRQGYAATEEPDDEYIIPFGKAKIVQEGTDATVICWGAMVQKTIEALKLAKIESGRVEIIDVRTLNPLDTESIETSLNKTGKVLIVYEDNYTLGPGAEISAHIADKHFEILDAPIRRVAAKNTPIPFNWFLEEAVLPQAADISEAITELLEY